MTLFGKILVMFNLGCAVFLAAWSYSIYATSIDWSGSKTGQLALRTAKLEAMRKEIAPAQMDWLNARSKLAKEETHLGTERVWYDIEIRHVLSRQDKGKPLTEVALAARDDDKSGVKKGHVLVDAQGYPKMVPLPVPLLSLREYNEEDTRILNSLAAVMAQYVAQITDANELTDKIIGDKAKGIRGFQERIFDEQAKSAALLAELNLIEPQLINTMVEAQTVNKRRNQMVKRIEELKKIKVASK